LSSLEAVSLACFNYFARNVATQNMRKIDAGRPCAPNIKMVHGAGPHTDQHLILRGFGSGSFRSEELPDHRIREWDRFQSGQRVLLAPMSFCNRCSYCTAGRQNQCLSSQFSETV